MLQTLGSNVCFIGPIAKSEPSLGGPTWSSRHFHGQLSSSYMLQLPSSVKVAIYTCSQGCEHSDENHQQWTILLCNSYRLRTHLQHTQVSTWVYPFHMDLWKWDELGSTRVNAFTWYNGSGVNPSCIQTWIMHVLVPYYILSRTHPVPRRSHART